MVGSSGTVFGRKPVTVVATSSNGKRVLVSGAHNGWTSAANFKAAV